VRTLFAVARYRAPSVIFIDEVDSLLTARKSDENESSRKMKTEFLVAIDGAKEEHSGHVLLIGATNKPHELDEAARRRFVKRLYVALPKEKDRAVLVKKLLEKNQNEVTAEEVDKIAKKTEGYSGADLFNLCQDAAMGPLRQAQARATREGRDHSMISTDEVGPITYKDLRRALKSTSRSVSDEDLQVYLDWDKTYGTKFVAVSNYDDDTESDHESDDEVS
jgi:SpoVK/Ycf46/Vps4 family AAA+-type ATPase